MKKTILIVSLVSLTIIFIGLIINFNPLNGQNMQKSNIEMIQLPEPRYDGEVSVERAIHNRRSIRSYSNAPLTLEEVSQLLWSAQGITDPTWNLRTAPSAGALYPLEIYLVSGNVIDLKQGIYKYDPIKHELALLQIGDKRMDLASSALGQSSIIDAAIVIVFAAVFERTTIKYGERGIKYVYIEVGHSAQNIYLQAYTLGLGCVVIGAFYNDKVKKTLNIPVNEEPIYIMPVGKKIID